MTGLFFSFMELTRVLHMHECMKICTFKVFLSAALFIRKCTFEVVNIRALDSLSYYSEYIAENQTLIPPALSKMQYADSVAADQLSHSPSLI